MRVSGKIPRWFVAVSKRPVPVHTTGYYPPTYPDGWNKQKEEKHDGKTH